ncbi:hypothetical protein CDL12_25612 [Handroanthus impetiginosus]|uniref:Protein FAR1-RELATED SEQUENCE n=1 Tax=Handroanthus impetiginosus TaxID=429701 RepID=A0A2G9G9D0_9LAMI|nr:hypothetical protein CDL12_25612 [Handroanthus impetiginosus]
MGEKKPISILTDQDAAMRVAVEIEYPEARHRICSWHLERNAMQHTHKPGFASEFGFLISRRLSVEEFEIAWCELVEKHGVANHRWVADVYGKKEAWSEAYFRGHFMAFMTSTQRSESMNALLKLSLKPTCKLVEFMREYHNSLYKIRLVFFEKQHDSETSTPSVRSRGLKSLKKHAARIYTKELFAKVWDEFEKEQNIVMEEYLNEDNCHLTLKFGNCEKVNDRQCVVNIDCEQSIFQCECLKLESDGIICCHLMLHSSVFD